MSEHFPSGQPAPVPALAPLTGRTHELKTDAHVFSEVTAGRKLFEIRKNDRDFRCGDLLRLRSTRCTGAEMAAGQPLIYTGEEITVRVIGILRGPVYGLAEGWVIMSIAAPAATQAQAEPALYIGGQYHDGSMSVCELATGRILHKFRLDGPSAPVGDGDAQPAWPMKDHELRELVNTLRDVAIKYHATQQLRERIAQVVHPWARPATQPEGQEAHPDTERLDWLERWHDVAGKPEGHGDTGIDIICRVSDGFLVDPEYGGGTYDMLREAIDAARAAQAGGGK